MKRRSKARCKGGSDLRTGSCHSWLGEQSDFHQLLPCEPENKAGERRSHTKTHCHCSVRKPAPSRQEPKSSLRIQMRLSDCLGDAAQWAACKRNPQLGAVKQVCSLCTGQAAKLHIKNLNSQISKEQRGWGARDKTFPSDPSCRKEKEKHTHKTRNCLSGVQGLNSGTAHGLTERAWQMPVS